MKQAFIAAILLLALSTGATTVQNNDSCDIGTHPAATLLLPYFEVDVNSLQTVALTTLFTVINTSQSPQIARVTLWTDLGYPVTNFNLFLTGYDVQSINLRDVLFHGPVAAWGDGATPASAAGPRSLPNSSNPNFSSSAGPDCANHPQFVPDATLNDVRNAFTIGAISGCGKGIGLVHKNAVGYATIDVVRTCGLSFPTDVSYWNEILHDNVLTGDYEIINPHPATGNYASGSPLVHIRAVSNMPYTFYDRYTPRFNPGIDRRQPLPSVFAARFVQGGTGAFNTNLLIWREGITGAAPACSDYPKNFGSATVIADVIRFDEHENPTTIGRICTLTCAHFPPLPETSSTQTSSGIFPPLSNSGDTGGWIYLNLDNSGSSAYNSDRASQNWVTVMLSAEGRFSTAFDAAQLGNGCSPPRLRDATIGPAP